MRSDDVIEQIDGKDWWDYGTYQAQLRAYDGKPHAFTLERGTAEYHVQLSAPFALAAQP